MLKEKPFTAAVPYAGKCWLLYAKPEHGSAKWLSEVSVGRYVFWLHGTDAHTKSMQAGDTAIIYIAAEKQSTGHIHCLGVIPFVRKPFIYDKLRERQRIPVMITHDFRESPINWQVLVGRANKQLDASEAFDAKLNPTSGTGAVHSVADPIQRALSEYTGVKLPLSQQKDQFDAQQLWRDIVAYGERFIVFSSYVTAAQRRKGEAHSLPPISSVEAFLSLADEALNEWPESPPQDEPAPSKKDVVDKYAHPLDDKESIDDHLNRGHIIQSLQAIILRDKDKINVTPEKLNTNHLIIGLFGDWGSGKSTIINQLEDRLTSGNLVEVIKFNAWRESHSSHMSASLTHHIINSLFEKLTYFPRTLLTVLSWRKINRKKIGADLLFALLFLLMCVFIMALTIGQSDATVLANILLPASAVGIIGSLVFYAKKLLGANYLISNLRQATAQPSFDKHIGIGYAMKESLDAVLSLYNKDARHIWNTRQAKSHKYVIVIDDLDRCSDRVIVQTLEAAQLIVDVNNVTVIFAVDFKILIKAVANKYIKQLEQVDAFESLALARQYLGKLFQVTISLSDPNKAALECFVRKRIYALADNPDEDPQEHKVPEEGAREAEATMNTNRNEATQGYTNPINTGKRNIDSNDFLATNEYEYHDFLACAEAFSLRNPRSLVRLFNVIAFSKSSEPLLTDDEEALKLMMFIAFYWENMTASAEHVCEAKDVFATANAFIDKASRHPLAQTYGVETAELETVEILLNVLKTYAMPIYELPAK